MFENETSTETVHRGLRASNTVHTLRPTEVVAVPEYPNPPSPESESDEPVPLEDTEEDRTWVLALILDRLEELEEKFEALIARIEKHDIRASHRILRD